MCAPSPPAPGKSRQRNFCVGRKQGNVRRSGGRGETSTTRLLGKAYRPALYLSRGKADPAKHMLRGVGCDMGITVGLSFRPLPLLYRVVVPPTSLI